jgi:FixJ family two-component response regulator
LYFTKGQLRAVHAGSNIRIVDTPERRIAIVDDDPSLCRALTRLLRLNGFAVDTFTTGEEFLESLAEKIPSCLILDLQMPGLTGFDVLGRLSAASQSIPVVTITGFDSAAARERALGGGAAIYLRKPVGEEVLLEAIERCITAEPTHRPEAAIAAAEEKRFPTEEKI